MNQQTLNSNAKADKKMDSEQFTQVVGAIVDGKYSWACFLVLQFAGYNPLLYIPYRTYNRLVKEHCKGGEPSGLQTSQRITDLSHLEGIGKQHAQIRGGALAQWLGRNIRESSSIRTHRETGSSLTDILW